MDSLSRRMRPHEGPRDGFDNMKSVDHDTCIKSGGKKPASHCTAELERRFACLGRLGLDSRQMCVVLRTQSRSCRWRVRNDKVPYQDPTSKIHHVPVRIRIPRTSKRTTST